MNKLFFAFLFLLPLVSFGQLPLFRAAVSSGKPDILYYKFYNGVQMIEVDYLSAYHRKVSDLEQTQPRALPWAMVLGPPRPNQYLFRNKEGKIVKQYGGAGEEQQFLSVENSIIVAITHRSFGQQPAVARNLSETAGNYFPYYLIGNGSVGLLDSLGNVVLPQAYDRIWKQDNLFITVKGATNELRDLGLKIQFSSDKLLLQPAQFHQGYVDVIQGDKRGLMDAAGKIMVPCRYDMFVGEFNEVGLARVSRAALVGYVNKLGKEVILCKYQEAGYFKEGLLDVSYGDKWGYINAAGKTIIPHKYAIGIWFVEGLARVAQRRGSNDWLFGFIDKKGHEVIPLSYADARNFANGTAEVLVDGNWVKINKTGKRVE